MAAAVTTPAILAQSFLIELITGSRPATTR
jgi:hypothetical protein